MSDTPFEDPTDPQPVPVPVPPTAAPLPKAKNVTLTAHYERSAQPEQYQQRKISYIMEAEFGPLTSDQADLLLSNMTTLLKMRAGLELGIESEINDHGVLQEIAKVFPGTRQASVPQAPAPRQGRAQAPAPEADAGPFDGPAEYAPAQNQAPLPDESNHPENAIWKAFFDDASRFYDDIDSDHPRIKHKQSGDTGWLNAAPEWVIQQLGVPRPAPPQNRGGGRGNGGGGYGGGNNRGGGGGGYQGSRTGGGGGGYRGGGGGGNRY